MKSTWLSSERGYLLAATILLLILFTRLYLNRQPTLNQAEREYAAGTKINLQPGIRPEASSACYGRGITFPMPGILP